MPIQPAKNPLAKRIYNWWETSRNEMVGPEDPRYHSFGQRMRRQRLSKNLAKSDIGRDQTPAIADPGLRQQLTPEPIAGPPAPAPFARSKRQAGSLTQRLTQMSPTVGGPVQIPSPPQADYPAGVGSTMDVMQQAPRFTGDYSVPRAAVGQAGPMMAGPGQVAIPRTMTNAPVAPTNPFVPAPNQTPVDQQFQQAYAGGQATPEMQARYRNYLDVSHGRAGAEPQSRVTRMMAAMGSPEQSAGQAVSPIDQQYQELLAQGRVTPQMQAEYDRLQGLRGTAAGLQQLNQRQPGTVEPQQPQPQRRSLEQIQQGFAEGLTPQQQAQLVLQGQTPYGAGSTLSETEGGGFRLTGRGGPMSEETRDRIQERFRDRMNTAQNRQWQIYQTKRKPNLQERMEFRRPELAFARRNQELGMAGIQAREREFAAAGERQERMQGAELGAQERMAAARNDLDRFLGGAQLGLAKRQLRQEYGLRGRELDLAERQVRATNRLQKRMLAMQDNRTKFEQDLMARGASREEAQQKFEQDFAKLEMNYRERRTDLEERMVQSAEQRAGRLHRLDVLERLQDLQDRQFLDPRERARMGIIAGAQDPALGQWQLQNLDPMAAQQGMVGVPQQQLQEIQALTGGSRYRIRLLAQANGWPPEVTERILAAIGTNQAGRPWLGGAQAGQNPWIVAGFGGGEMVGPGR